MNTRYLDRYTMERYKNYLIEEERSAATIEKYTRDINMLYQFLPEGKKIDKAMLVGFKKHLVERYSVRTVNSVLAAVSGLLKFLGWQDIRVSRMKTQKEIFCSDRKELTREEYLRLLNAAKSQQNKRLYLIMQTICSTGIRVSELKHITVEAVKEGRAHVRCKSKHRVVFISGKLRQVLLRYAKEMGVKMGMIFITRGGRPVHRANIWSDMKQLCKTADVSPEKVFPHNLRHLFARTYYNLEKDIVSLADVLGHSSIETTRIYTISTGREHEKRINALKLVI